MHVFRSDAGTFGGLAKVYHPDGEEGGPEARSTILVLHDGKLAAWPGKSIHSHLYGLAGGIPDVLPLF